MGTSTNLAISGLASGFDWQSLISQLVQVERTPETLLQEQQATMQSKNNVLSTIKTELGVLQNAAKKLMDPTFFDTRTATSSDTTLATATADTGTTRGTYNFVVNTVATASVLKGSSGISSTLSSTDDVSGLTLSSAGLATAITAGTFSVNGKTVTIATTDTLQNVFDKISTATGGAVTGSYSASSDEVTLSSSSAITLGSSTDTSNFLTAMKLSTGSNTGTVTSSSTLGALNTSVQLSKSNLKTAVSDGGSGNGAFVINGVTINYSTSSDSIQNVLDRINDSDAGVTASYNSVTKRFSLTNSSTGDVGITASDTTGNFLSATGLSGGTLASGTDLTFTVDGGDEISSHSNAITADVSGITGLKVSVLKTGSFSVSVAADTSTIKSGITDFVNQYNTVQKEINTDIASTTVSGTVTAGTLTGDNDIETLNTTLRNLFTSDVSGLAGTLKNLDALGFASNGNDDSLSTSDTTNLDDALSNNLAGLKALFSSSTTGLASKVYSFMDDTIGDSGTLVAEQSSLTKQSSDIDTQIAQMETNISAYKDRLTTEFVNMETAEATINQQLSYLSKAFTSSSG